MFWRQKHLRTRSCSSDCFSPQFPLPELIFSLRELDCSDSRVGQSAGRNPEQSSCTASGRNRPKAELRRQHRQPALEAQSGRSRYAGPWQDLPPTSRRSKLLARDRSVRIPPKPSEKQTSEAPSVPQYAGLIQTVEQAAMVLIQHIELDDVFRGERKTWDAVLQALKNLLPFLHLPQMAVGSHE